MHIQYPPSPPGHRLIVSKHDALSSSSPWSLLSLSLSQFTKSQWGGARLPSLSTLKRSRHHRRRRANERSSRANSDPPVPLQFSEMVNGRAALPPVRDVIFEIGDEFRGVCLVPKKTETQNSLASSFQPTFVESISCCLLLIKGGKKIGIVKEEKKEARKSSWRNFFFFKPQQKGFKKKKKKERKKLHIPPSHSNSNSILWKSSNPPSARS